MIVYILLQQHGEDCSKSLTSVRLVPPGLWNCCAVELNAYMYEEKEQAQSSATKNNTLRTF